MWGMLLGAMIGYEEERLFRQRLEGMSEERRAEALLERHRRSVEAAANRQAAALEKVAERRGSLLPFVGGLFIGSLFD